MLLRCFLKLKWLIGWVCWVLLARINLICESDAIIVHVPYDNEFVQNVLLQLEHFYFKSLLPKLVDDFDKGLLVFDSSYKSCAY
jgi:hypothetical protein